MSASQELLNEVACHICEHSDEIAAVAIEEYRASYPHLKRFSMSPERAKEWSASALEEIAQHLEMGAMEGSAYRFFHGALITQASTEHLALFNYIEDKTMLAKIILAFIWQTQAFDPVTPCK